jgi:alanine-glyoxylate transaminase / serine-glyoxylate transaminase / serine-pyruvate transaminase
VTLSDRVLMGPGPSNLYPEVEEALTRPLLGHLDPEFLALLDETCDRLRQVMGTANRTTLPLSGTGSAGMEACFVNLVRPGDPVVVGVNGLFGERMCDVATRCGATVVAVEAPWGQPLDPERLLTAHPDPRLIAVVHAETSTGVRNEVGQIGRDKGDALLLVDCVTSLGGIPVEVDGWGIDLCYSATQKCLGVPPGLAPVTLGEEAVKRRVETPRSWYLDLGMIADYVDPGGARKYHHTAPVTMVYALHAGLGALLEEGVKAAWERHEACGRELQAGLLAQGFELFATEGYRLPQLTTVSLPPGLLPAGLDEATARRQLLERYGIEIGGGLGAFAGKVWRIGCMGHTARPRNVSLVLAALDEVLRR